MKNRIIIIILAIAVVAAFALGATGTIPFAKEGTGEKNGLNDDRLIGVFITTEYLDSFDYESYLNDNIDKVVSSGEINQADCVPYQEKIFAKLVDEQFIDSETGETIKTKKFVFEGVKGIPYFAAKYDSESEHSYWGTEGDDAISDGSAVFNSTDAGESIELTGTIYLSTSASDDMFYYNPVYQTPSGEVYTIAGESVSYGGELHSGMSVSQALKGEQTITVDKKSETVSTSVKVGLCFMDTPTATRILQFDKNSRIVSSTKYEANGLPSEITPKTETQFIIVETYTESADGNEAVSRELFKTEDESLFTFSCRKDGVCIKEYCEILWKE